MIYFIIFLFFLMAWWIFRLFREEHEREMIRDNEEKRRSWKKEQEQYSNCEHEMRYIVWPANPYAQGGNYYGLVNNVCRKCGYTIPVTCPHGGSMYMDKGCYEMIVEWVAKDEQNRILDDLMPFGE
jgi:hypothetical protein